MKVYQNMSRDAKDYSNNNQVEIGDSQIKGHLYMPRFHQVEQITEIIYNGWGNTVATAGKLKDGRNFVLNCLSSSYVGMGNCNCNSHSVWEFYKED